LSKLLWFFYLAIGLYLVGGVLLWAFQNKLIFLPTRASLGTPATVGLEYESLTLKTPDGEQLDAWFVPAKNARGTILFCHGNAGNISNRIHSIRLFNKLGLSVLIFDYRGYGNSTGTPSEHGTYTDAQAAWDYLVEKRGLSSGNIIVFGRSLGAAVAANLATKNKPRALILETAFLSVAKMAQEIYRIYPARLLTWIKFDTSAALAKIKSPVLLIHSREDEIIPYAHGQALFKQARNPKMFLEIFGNHNDGFLTSGALYTSGIDRFLKLHLEPKIGRKSP